MMYWWIWWWQGLDWWEWHWYGEKIASALFTSSMRRQPKYFELWRIWNTIVHKSKKMVRHDISISWYYVVPLHQLNPAVLRHPVLSELEGSEPPVCVFVIGSESYHAARRQLHNQTPRVSLNLLTQWDEVHCSSDNTPCPNMLCLSGRQFCSP